jgi:hypothetical protein
MYFTFAEMSDMETDEREGERLLDQTDEEEEAGSGTGSRNPAASKEGQKNRAFSLSKLKKNCFR